MDEILSQIGEFGPTQKKIYFLICLVDVFAGLHILTLSFIAFNPEWKCLKPPEDGGDTPSEITDLASKCWHYEHGKCTPVYSTEYTSIVAEWDLVCDKSSLPNLSQCGFFIGLAVGAWVFGTMADRIGRRNVLFLTVLGTCVSGLGFTLVHEIYSFAVLRVIVGIFVSGAIVSCYVLRVEIVGTSARSFAGVLGGVFFAAGYVLLAVFAYFIHDWRALCTVCAITGLPYLLLWRIVPESPRWLLLNGQEEQAREVLARFARGNGTSLPEGTLKKPIQSESEGVSIRDLFRGRIIRRRTVILVFIAFVNAMVYYVIALNTGQLGGNRFVSFILTGIVDMPSALCVCFLVKRKFHGYQELLVHWQQCFEGVQLFTRKILVLSSGRRWTHGGLLITSGIGCLAWIVLHLTGSGAFLKIAVALLGKFAVAGSFAVAFLYATELLPTQVRNLGSGLTMVGSRVGGIVAPLVLILEQYSDVFPMLVVGGLAVIGGTVSLSLPETLDQPLPETVAELETTASY